MPEESITVRGRAGTPIDLPVAQGPPTGYIWTLQLSPKVQQLPDGPPRPPAPGTHLGAGTGAVLRVVAPRGEHTVTATLSRPWQPDKFIQRIHIRLIVE